MKAHALDLAANGWAVLPLAGKTPLTKHGHLDASTDLDVIASWWLRWPYANIGARVPEQLVVLDVDPRNGGDFDALTPEPTLTAWSGRGDGGCHLYYLRPPFALSSTRLPKGIDLKNNGYMVMPPSIHPATGEPYTWFMNSIAELPRHLGDLLKAVPSLPRPLVRRGDGNGLVSFVESQTEGNRNNGLFWAACRAAEDGVLDDIAEALITAATDIGISEHSARAQVASAKNRPVSK